MSKKFYDSLTTKEKRIYDLLKEQGDPKPQDYILKMRSNSLLTEAEVQERSEAIVFSGGAITKKVVKADVVEGVVRTVFKIIKDYNKPFTVKEMLKLTTDFYYEKFRQEYETLKNEGSNLPSFEEYLKIKVIPPYKTISGHISDLANMTLDHEECFLLKKHIKAKNPNKTFKGHYEYFINPKLKNLTWEDIGSRYSRFKHSSKRKKPFAILLGETIENLLHSTFNKSQKDNFLDEINQGLKKGTKFLKSEPKRKLYKRLEEISQEIKLKKHLDNLAEKERRDLVKKQVKERNRLALDTRLGLGLGENFIDDDDEEASED